MVKKMLLMEISLICQLLGLRRGEGGCFLTSQRLPPLALHLSAASWRWMDHLLA